MENRNIEMESFSAPDSVEQIETGNEAEVGRTFLSDSEDAAVEHDTSSEPPVERESTGASAETNAQFCDEQVPGEPSPGEPDTHVQLTTEAANSAEESSESDNIDSELMALRAQIADLQRELRGQAADVVFTELRSEGYALPERHVTALRQFAQSMHDDAIHFSETESTPVADWLREFLRATAPRVPLGLAAHNTSPAPGSAPSDYQVQFTERTDPDSVELHHRAIQLMQNEPTLPYSAALSKAAAL